MQPRCQAEMCHVPAECWSCRKGHCLSREQLLSSLCGCRASVRAGNGSPFNMLTLLLMPSLSPSQNRWLTMGQRDGHIWKGGAGLAELVEESCNFLELWEIRQILGFGTAPLVFQGPLSHARVGQH